MHTDVENMEDDSQIRDANGVVHRITFKTRDELQSGPGYALGLRFALALCALKEREDDVDPDTD